MRLVLLVTTLVSLSAGATTPPTLDQRRKELTALIDEEWQSELRESPETATTYGDDRYNDRWSDLSIAHIRRQKLETAHFLARFEAVDTTDFPEQERLNRELMTRNLKDALEGFELKTYEMPVDQFSGIHLWLAQLVALVPLDSAKHHEDYLARLHALPRLLDQVTVLLKAGTHDGLLPPRFLLEKVVTQCTSIATPAGAANAFGQPASHIPETIPAARRKKLHDAILKAVDTEVRPAYRKLAAFIAKSYAPKGRLDPGLWALPDGDRRYRSAVRIQTTTNLEPDAIHALGLAEVARIEAEQSAIALKLGASDLTSFRATLRNDPARFATSRQQILDRYTTYIAQMQPELPRLFGLLPKARVEVVATETFREAEAAMAEYSLGTPDGSRPGRVEVNTGDFAKRSLLSTESTAYHEGVPGHHMQLSIAQELSSLPAFRQHAGYTAYVEGWALYAERLGKEVGFYTDPYSDFGRLNDELLRACRLVLDTGVHAKHWTRAQMVAYFREHSGEDEPDIQAETDRYIAAPGQALAYKLGQLQILELRKHAQDALGEGFDIRVFHDEVLSGGALPLDVLRERLEEWISERRKARAK